MKSNLIPATIAVAAAIGSVGMVPVAQAAADDSTVFGMVRSAGAYCVNAGARGRVTISDMGQVQNLHVEVSKLPPNKDFTIFVITTPNAPFVPAWYQGDLTTDKSGNGVADMTGIFSDETFILNPGPVGVTMSHLGMWFADPAQAVAAGCPGTVTPFDGDREAGIQVLNTSNFPDARGPLRRIQ